MYAHGTRFLRKSGHRGFQLFAGGHEQVGKLINDDNDIWQETMSFVGTQAARSEEFVVFGNVAHAGFFE